MQDGCVFEPDYHSTKCQKYGIFCHGKIPSKHKCPEWGQTVALEKYLQEKLEYEKNNEDFS